MMKIYKYPLAVIEYQELTIPGQATILKVDSQGGQLCLWAAVEPNGLPAKYRIKIFGTGHDVESDILTRHIGTVLMPPYVWHVFGWWVVNGFGERKIDDID